MRTALQIVFHQMQPSAALEAKVRQRVDALERLGADILRCRVGIEPQHRRHHNGNLFRVRVNLNVPGKEIVVSHAPEADHAHEDAYVAIRDAFDAVRRQLADYLRVRRGEVKQHFAATAAE